jgi:hypothetical protein
MGGRIDVLVNCAGIQRRSPSLDFLETDWDDVRARYAPHLSTIFLITITRSRISPLDPSFVYPDTFLYFPGLGRQSQVRLAPFSSRRPSHGPQAARKNHKLLFPPDLPRRNHSSCLCRGQRCTGPAYESPEQ